MQKYLLNKQVYLFASLYFLLTTLFHWRLHPNLDIVIYLAGAIIGLHLLEAVENVFNFEASPFKNVIVQGVLTVITFFVLTSSGNMLGKGVVLFLNLKFLLLQQQELSRTQKLESWFTGMGILSYNNYRIYLGVLGIVFSIETLLFSFI